jgi:hypothetical protein
METLAKLSLRQCCVNSCQALLESRFRGPCDVENRNDVDFTATLDQKCTENRQKISDTSGRRI